MADDDRLVVVVVWGAGTEFASIVILGTPVVGVLMLSLSCRDVGEVAANRQMPVPIKAIAAERIRTLVFDDIAFLHVVTRGSSVFRSGAR
ncbi:hypothetical protein CEE58_14870 [Stenotrophomonas maltophilia]|nr:hypothetical protein CEE58_14870 [Stenotrophomonas maltophilia]